jgi:hypothetical protein
MNLHSAGTQPTRLYNPALPQAGSFDQFQGKGAFPLVIAGEQEIPKANCRGRTQHVDEQETHHSSSDANGTTCDTNPSTVSRRIF